MGEQTVKHLALVEVEWVDSTSRGGGRYEDDYLKDTGPAKCKSAGYLLAKNPSHVMLVQSIDTENPEYMMDVITIPRKAVLSVRELK